MSQSTAQTLVTRFGSLGEYEKGHIELINDNAKNYAFSNVFEVASASKPYEKVVVAKNLEYVIETIRAEGSSGWMAAGHDEFAVCLDGEVSVEFIKLEDANTASSQSKNGTVAIQGEPVGRRMGRVRLKRGHQTLLPQGAAYRFTAPRPSVLIQQTLLGPLSVEKWADICLS